MSALVRSLNGPSTADAVARHLVESINGAELRPGQELDLGHLAQVHEVRLPALRSTLVSLVSGGLIEMAGDRAVVSKLDPNLLADVWEMRRTMHSTLFERGADIIVGCELDRAHDVLQAEHDQLVRKPVAAAADAVVFNKVIRNLLLRLVRPACGDADLRSLHGLFGISRRYIVLGWAAGNQITDPEDHTSLADIFDSIDYLRELIDTIRLRRPGAIKVAYGRYMDQIEEIAHASLISEFVGPTKRRRRLFAVPDL